ncbi:hypothetical protein BJY52DRAFT_1215022 [Lactarius psammicola]|nr:hypothetical protein BJY52DRAFT_1215022 [Lactarius psammicola]
MVIWCKAPIYGISWSPNGQFIAAAGSKSVEIRDTLIGSSVVSIDSKPLFYISSDTDEVHVGDRLKGLVQIRAMPTNGRTESRIVKTLKFAEDIASRGPVPGLKNVFSSLLALVHAGYNGHGLTQTLVMEGLEIRIRSFARVMLMQIMFSSDFPRQVIDGLEEFIRTIETITATCRHKLSQGRLERIAVGMGIKYVRAHLEREVSISYSRISDALKQFMKRVSIQQLEDVVEVKRTIEPITSKRTKNPNLSTHAQRAECLEGTRTVVLDEIFAWLKDASGARIFWLSGIAGSGKSAVAQSASIRAALLTGHIVTLAFQFSLLDLGYKERVSEVINEHPDIFEQDLRFQYKKLIIETLDAIRRPHSCILIILDGLDECEPHGMTAVLKVLLAEDVDHPKELRILTASRPETHLCKIFDAQRDIRRLSLEDVETESDIRHYLRTSFEQPPTPLVNPFTVSEGTISELTKRAGSSFIYAATIVRFVFDEYSQDPQRQVDFLLNNRADPEQHPYARLDALFLRILQQALPLGASSDEKRRLRTILGLLVCLREPFPIREMERFYELDRGDVKRALHHLHSLVQVPIRDDWAPHIYHRSFTDFIVNPARCPDQNLVVDIGSIENRIFNKCSSLCDLWQRKVVNDLGENDSRENGHAKIYTTTPLFSIEEQYACLYWASHLTNTKDVDESTQYYLDDRCLLRWIERLALLGMLREAVTLIDQIRTWMISLKGLADKASDRRVDLMDNAFRLLLHATTISFHMLFIYDSALFTSTAKVQPHVVEVKSSRLYSLRDFSHGLNAHSELVSDLMPTSELKLWYDSDFTPVLAWSPNSQYIAVSRVNGIEIWDALSGSIVDSFSWSSSLEHVLDDLDHQRVSCPCLAYYPDNSRIAYDTGGEVHVRNTLARTEVFVVTGHEGGLVNINVSPNGKLLVFGSKSGCIRVCSAENGAPVWAVETSTELKSTLISPNSRLIVSLPHSHDHGVQIWNANDGLPLSIIPYHVISVSFSADSNHLTSVDEEGLVRVWGTSQMTTEPIQERRICAQPACLCSSPDDRHLAAATGDNVYILRRDAQGDDVATLNGHTRPVTSLAFSVDGLTLASGSLDGTIRVWDTSSIGNTKVGKSKQEKLDEVIWSPRGQAVMMSNLVGSKVWIWSTQDGTSTVIEGYSDGFPLAISDCGRYLAARSRNPGRITTRRIASNVAQSNSFSLMAPRPHCREFFPNSTRFAVTSGKEISTWDASVARREVTRLVGHSKEVDDLYFVPDGSRLLSKAGEEVFAWNVDTLQLVSIIGNVIPRYHTPMITPMIGTADDNWVVMTLPDHGGRRCLFRLPSEYQPYGDWSITESWSSKCIVVRRGDGKVLIVNFSAIPAAMIDLQTVFQYDK